MKINEHLALFVMGIVTLGITLLLLVAFRGVSPTGTQQFTPQQASASLQPQLPSMAALDSEVADTFTKAGVYLAKGTFEEKEHIEILERLEFYRGLSSINLARKKAAHDYIKDMEHLLTLKASVARQVKLSGQINAAVTDAHIHLTEGERNRKVAQRIKDRLESLYAIQGLSSTQNKMLKTSLTEIKRAYKSTPQKAATITKPSRKTSKPKKVTARKVTPKIVKAKTQPKAAPVPKAPVAATTPTTVKSTQSATQVATKYYRVMTEVSRYFVVGAYDKPRHDKLTDDLYELSGSATLLSAPDQMRLTQSVQKMEQIELSKGFKGIWGSK
jgi:hypothetical protein